MDLQRIKTLLDKYYQGKTSLEEEKNLKEYFKLQNSLDSNIADKQLINYFTSNKIFMPADFYLELNNLVENESKNEQKRRIIKIIKWTSSIAAVFIMAIGILIYNKKENPPLYADTFKNPDEAYMETKQVLLFISKTMNSKTNGLKYLSNVDISLKHCTELSKIDKTLNSIKNENN